MIILFLIKNICDNFEKSLYANNLSEELKETNAFATNPELKISFSADMR
jgi:hypothetical protein